VSAARNEAREFLTALFDGLPGWIEVCAVAQDGSPRRTRHGGPLDAHSHIQGLRDAGCTFHVGIATRREWIIGTRVNLAALRALWAKVALAEAAARETATARLLALPITPSIVVSTSDGLYACWLLAEPIDLSDPAMVERVERLLAGLAGVLEGDRSAAEASWCTPVPGTTNHRGRTRSPVALVEINRCRYRLEDFEEFERQGAVSRPNGAAVHGAVLDVQPDQATSPARVVDQPPSGSAVRPSGQPVVSTAATAEGHAAGTGSSVTSGDLRPLSGQLAIPPHLYQSTAPQDAAGRYRPELEALVAECAGRIHLPDPATLTVPLAAWAANFIPGRVPCWLMVVGPSSTGKTIVLQSFAGLARTVLASDLTEAGLLSGSSRRDRARNATGGLLVGFSRTRGVLVLKDFTSVLSFHTDKRQAVLAALREIYDGRWDRDLGTDGGQRFTFEGHVGLIAACTTTIDTHHTVIAMLGERFIYLRHRDLDREQQAQAALRTGGVADIKPLIHAFLQGVACEPRDPDGDEFRFISDLSQLGSRLRSTVERDPYRRDIIVPPAAEAPARLTGSLLSLWNGLVVIGVERQERLRLLLRVACDSMPEARYRGVRALYFSDHPLSIEEVTAATRISESATRRHLEDLEAFDLVTHEPAGREYVYALTAETRAALRSLRHAAGLEDQAA
jgi:hypothetical protein